MKCKCPLVAIILVLILRSYSGTLTVQAFSPVSTIAASYAGGQDGSSSNSTGVACAIVAGGTQRVLCWGQESGPAMLPDDLGPFFGLVAGQSFFCGLVPLPGSLNYKRAVCWSAHNLTLDLQLPEEHQNRSFSTLAAGASHVCGISSGKPDGIVVCWNPGDKNSTNHPLGLTRYEKIATGNNFTCGIGKLHGNLSTLNCSGDAPAAIENGIAQFRSAHPEGALLSAISAGEAHLCVLVSNGSATNQPLCWGTFNIESWPWAEPSPGPGYHSLFSGYNFSCGIRYNDSRLDCWSHCALDVTGLGCDSKTVASNSRGSTYSVAAGNTFVCAISSLEAYCFGQGAPQFQEKCAHLFNPAVCQDNITSAQGQWYSPDAAALGLSPGQRFCKEDADNSFLPCTGPPCFSAIQVGPAGRRQLDDAPLSPPINKSPCPGHHWTPLEISALCVFPILAVCLLANCIPKLKLFPVFRSVQHFHDQEHVKVTEFTYRDLEEATGGFNEVNLIGRGSYGLVFKGMVQCPSKKVVAIKKLEQKTTSSQRNLYVDFDSELKLLARLQHPNLVNLIGYCHERVPQRKFRLTSNGVVCAVRCAIARYKYSKQTPSSVGAIGSKQAEVNNLDRRLLVFDYMANGCLYDHIHENQDNLSCASRVHPLSPLVSSWSMRLQIAGQAAKGLQYLHGLIPPVIHRDVKTSNILLDSEWNARLSDLGISRLGPQGQDTHVVTDPKGTPGYCDPEYFRTYHLTLKSDVYGFGVVLLELLTGQKAIDRQKYKEDANLVSRCRSVIQDGQIASILDGRIADDGPRQTESIAKLANIAELCVRDSPKERPSMRQVTSWIEKLLEAMSGRRHALDFDIESEEMSSSQVSDVGSDLGPHFSHSFSVDVKDVAGGIAITKIPGTFKYLNTKVRHQPSLPELPEETGTSGSQGSAGSASSAKPPRSGPLIIKRPTITITKQSYPETDAPPTLHHDAGD